MELTDTHSFSMSILTTLHKKKCTKFPQYSSIFALPTFNILQIYPMQQVHIKDLQVTAVIQFMNNQCDSGLRELIMIII